LIASLWLLAGSAVVPASAQTPEGATMTVLRGQVAVVHPDGSAIQPAVTGTVVQIGDEIRTLGDSGALITFFQGSEIELAEQTVMVVESISRQGGVIDVSLKQVIGSSLHRVQRLADPNASYKIDSGGAVTLVRGTQFLLLGPTAEGIVVLVCQDDCDSRSTFAGCALGPNIGYWLVQDRGMLTVPCQQFRTVGGYWAAANDALTSARQLLQGDRPSTDSSEH